MQTGRMGLVGAAGQRGESAPLGSKGLQLIGGPVGEMDDLNWTPSPLPPSLYESVSGRSRISCVKTLMAKISPLTSLSLAR